MRLSSSSFHRKSWLASLLAVALSLSVGLAVAQNDASSRLQRQEVR